MTDKEQGSNLQALIAADCITQPVAAASLNEAQRAAIEALGKDQVDALIAVRERVGVVNGSRII